MIVMMDAQQFSNKNRGEAHESSTDEHAEYRFSSERQNEAKNDL